MNVGLIIAIIYATFALITSILRDIQIAKKDKKEKVEKTFWESLQDSCVSSGCGILWPFTLPGLIQELFFEKNDTLAHNSKAESIVYERKAKEYIEREAYYWQINNLSKGKRGDYCAAINDCMTTLDEQPTADVEEVVRCKNCGNYCNNTGECNMYGHHPGEDGYCSGAMPRERDG